MDGRGVSTVHERCRSRRVTLPFKTRTISGSQVTHSSGPPRIGPLVWGKNVCGPKEGNVRFTVAVGTVVETSAVRMGAQPDVQLTRRTAGVAVDRQCVRWPVGGTGTTGTAAAAVVPVVRSTSICIVDVVQRAPVFFAGHRVRIPCIKRGRGPPTRLPQITGR